MRLLPVAGRPSSTTTWLRLLTLPATLVPAILALAVIGSSAAAPPAPAAARDEVAPGVWPLDPQPAVVHGFDPPEVRWGAGHRGVDLAGRVGQQVRAALAGTVTFAGQVAGRGVVVVDHGTTRTTYQPVAASVRRGTDVGRGQVIGTLAWFGSHCLPAACLHWGLLEGQSYLDPLSLVGGPRPVRLLPLIGGALSSPAASGAGDPAPPRSTLPSAHPWSARRVVIGPPSALVPFTGTHMPGPTR